MNTAARWETTRILLRTINEKDIEDFLSYRSDPRIAAYQYWEPFNYEQALEYIRKYRDSKPGIPGTWYQLGIVHKGTNRLIGDCALKTDEFEPRNGEFGCSLSFDFQKMGLAKEALSCVFDFAFNDLKMHRISAITDCENIACIRLLEKLYMRQEGHFIDNVWFKGKWGSEYCYALLDREWKH